MTDIFDKNREAVDADKQSTFGENCELKGVPQGEEGNPKQCIKTSSGTEEPHLDRRPADTLRDDQREGGEEQASVVAGIQSDQQNSSENDSRPSGQYDE